MSVEIKSPRKLIEVALPLDKINEAAAATKRKAPKGYPTTLHNWWAQRPVAAARAVIFGQLVNDPEDLWRHENPGLEPNQQVKGHWTKSRARLFQIIEELVKWENTTNEDVLRSARDAISESWRQVCLLNKDHPRAKELFDVGAMPGLHDPFAGSGAIPLEAQRLGLEAFASDLNPVAVLINKAAIEIPPRFEGCAPVNREWKAASEAEKTLTRWSGAQGLAADVLHYGQWMRDEAERRIGHLYPKAEVTAALVNDRPDLKPYLGQKLTVIAWLWARTVKSPNPAFASVDVPLASTFMLSTKAGKEAFVEPIVEGGSYRFTVRVGPPFDQAAAKNGTKLSRANFRCLMSDAPISGDYIKAEGNGGRIGAKLMAIVAEGSRGRVFLPPTEVHEAAAREANPQWKPEGVIATRMTGGNCTPYGLTSWGDLFTDRQLVSINTFCDLIEVVKEKVRTDAAEAGLSDDGLTLEEGGNGCRAYAEAIAVYLSFAISRIADYGSTISTWRSKDNAMRSTFAKQAIPMTWDFAEGSPLAKSSSGFKEAATVVSNVIQLLPSHPEGHAQQADAQTQKITSQKFVSIDPPYYDNIGYADLSDFFYVWLRKCLRHQVPSLLSTIEVPKSEELVATAYRHGSAVNAERFFLNGMTQAMANLASQAHPAAPMTIYYAFKQSETETSSGTSSSGWETFLEAVLRSGLTITGTWPMRTEGDNRQMGQDANALASSIVLVCRPRSVAAGTIPRRQFVRMLNDVLPSALEAMTRVGEGLHSPVAPVDLSQAIIGPGMGIFSKYDAVLEADGTPMTVKTAMRLINRFLAEDDFDQETQFCLHWFEQHGWAEGTFGDADQLARAKGAAVNGIQQAGVIRAVAGKVVLLRPGDYPADWDPRSDGRLPVWEVLHQLIRLLRAGGYDTAGAALAAASSKADAARQLAYRLYTLCERMGWAEDARAYNEIISSWTAIEDAASRAPKPRQANLFDA